MAEESRPWPGTTVGDAGPYSDDDWDDVWGILFGSETPAPYNDRGVIRNWANELEVTDGGANTADVATGAALVHGKFYNHTAPVINLAIPSSVGVYREDLVCLRSDWTPQTIRIFRHANPADGVAYPAPTQNDGVEWEIPLAAVRINAAGAITLITDLRDYVSDLMQPKEIQVIPRDAGVTYAEPGWHFAVLLDTPGQDADFEFVVPLDFKESVEAYVYLSAPANITIDWTCRAAWGGCDESYAANTDSVTADGQAISTGIVLCLDVSGAFDSGNLEPGDLVGVDFLLDAISSDSLSVFMLVFRYK